MRIQSRLAVAGLLAAFFVSGAWAGDEKFSAPKTLALGDSLTFGFQQHKFNNNPFDLEQFHTGFAFVFTRLMASTLPVKRVELLNLGCPGETTASFINGPCLYHAIGLPLHLNYSGSQLDAAEALLRAHRGNINPILISLGANDVLALLDLCPGLDPGCVGLTLPVILATVGQNLNHTLGRLRAAAPDVEIVLLQLYNPLEVAFPGSSLLAILLNTVIGNVAAAHGARVADAFPPFNLAPPQPARLCFLTLVCTPLGDIHASDAGYAVIAALMLKALSQTRFDH